MRNPLFVLSITLIFITLPCVTQAKVLDIQEVKSKSGLSAWLVEDHSVPVIALNFSFLNAGARNDPADKQGLARLAEMTESRGRTNDTKRAWLRVIDEFNRRGLQPGAHHQIVAPHPLLVVVEPHRCHPPRLPEYMTRHACCRVHRRPPRLAPTKG